MIAVFHVQCDFLTDESVCTIYKIKNSNYMLSISMSTMVCMKTSPLTTVGYLLEICIRQWIPSLVRISTSAWS